jgi:hypothetical protein
MIDGAGIGGADLPAVAVFPPLALAIEIGEPFGMLLVGCPAPLRQPKDAQMFAMPSLAAMSCWLR